MKKMLGIFFNELRLLSAPVFAETVNDRKLVPLRQVGHYARNGNRVSEWHYYGHV